MKRKKVFVFLLTVWGISLFPCHSFAMSSDDLKMIKVFDDIHEVSEMRKDIIITKYRVYYGRLQYRRWNTTTGTWVDPHWIDV